MQILFIHGRGQEDFVQEDLMKTWSDSLRLSFQNADIPYPENLNLQLPSYGKDLITQRDLYQKDIASGKYQMRSPNSEDELAKCQYNILDELRVNAGISKREVAAESQEEQQYRGENLPNGYIYIARVLDRYLKELPNKKILERTEDVATYLIVPQVRDEINKTVQASLTSDPTIIIAHSLGSVIAYDLLHSLSDAQFDIKGLITLGSPLGVRAVNRQLFPLQSFPVILKGPWINIYDSGDIVSLNPLIDKYFRVDPKIINYQVENVSINKHGISEYLSNKIVAQTIQGIVNYLT